MKRIVLDQGLPPAVVPILQSDQWDAVHVREIGMREAADAEILDYAGPEERVVITLDRDFPQILALTSATRPSVVPIRHERLRAPALADLLRKVWQAHEAALDQGCVVKVSARGTRARLLPLK